MDHGRGRDSDVAGSKIQCLRVPGWALLCETGMPSQGCRVEGGPPARIQPISPSPVLRSHHEAVRTHEPVSTFPRGGGPCWHLQPPSIPPGVGAFPPQPRPPGPVPPGEFHPPRPARSDNSPGGDPAAQRGLPREGSPLTPGLTRPEDKQLQIAPSPFPAGAAAVRPSSRLRCSPVRLDKRDARPELFGFVPYVQEKDAQGIPAALLADAPHSEGF